MKWLLSRVTSIGYVSNSSDECIANDHQELFDNHIRPQQLSEQNWPDFTEDFGVVNEEYYNYDIN